VKAWGIRRYKDAVELLELPRPEPGPNDLLVKVRAASVNPLDFKIRQGALRIPLAGGGVLRINVRRQPSLSGPRRMSACQIAAVTMRIAPVAAVA